MTHNSYLIYGNSDLNNDEDFIRDTYLPSSSIEFIDEPLTYLGSLEQASTIIRGSDFDVKAETIAGVTQKKRDAFGQKAVISHSKHFKANTDRNTIQHWLAGLMTAVTLPLHSLNRIYGGVEEDLSASSSVAWFTQQKRGRTVSLEEATSIAFEMSSIAEQELHIERDEEALYMRSFLLDDQL